MSANLHIFQALAAFFWRLVLPSSWRRPVRERIARQIVFAGVEATLLLIIVGAGVGVLASIYGKFWLDFTKRADLLHQMVNIGVVRELAPLLSVLLTLPANGAPMCSEMALMRVNREVLLLKCLGICEFTYLVFPRMLGLALSCCAGATILAASALVVCSASLTETLGDASMVEVLRRFVQDLEARSIAWMLVKSAAGGLLIACVAAVTGLSAGEARTEVPRMVSKAMKLALMWMTFTWFVLTTVSNFI
ncbi:MAG: ABC transporter permease [Verrucomicrobiaceae bacterium]|nr:ABC transporter permease [Verrucomicrobiaceae bacterium]